MTVVVERETLFKATEKPKMTSFRMILIAAVLIPASLMAGCDQVGTP